MAPEEPKPTGATPLIVVAGTIGHVETVDRLIAARADVNAKTKAGRSALSWAASKGHTEVASRLVAAGAAQ
eukprot:CAMPEP_0172172782 /NCGR_PEP_ID=MMETSP1050-20130122/12647_1 /TAXON_ID=233186 /ORGANISM="Cryptomonas curvata, Strain CCAP979/52" /LENGTH=70 /DNA_ID=CAMNT_0012844379 /DNA_START=1194 /DNA_END=1406 /DNA_ORIENTATION=+